MAVDFKAEMTLQRSFTPGVLTSIYDNHSDVLYFKGVGVKLAGLVSTYQLFNTPEAINSEIFYAAESRALAFSRSSDHLSGTLVRNYYENVQFNTMVMTATATGFGRTIICSLGFFPCTIDQIIPNIRVPNVFPTYVDLVSIITDAAKVYPGVPHETALLLARRDRLLEARNRDAP